MAFSNDQLVVACRAWLDTARREWVKRNPDKDCPLPTWVQLGTVERMAFMATVEATLNAAHPDNVKKVLERDAAQ